MEDENIISEGIKTGKTFNDYFINIPTQNILIKISSKLQLIKAKNKSQTFRFTEINTDEIKKSIKKHLKKVIQFQTF